MKKLAKFLELIAQYKPNPIPFSNESNIGIGSKFIYCPHPFTNWSLNPAFENQEGQRIHTKEGFRRTDREPSTVAFCHENPDAYKIYCVGGSSTYCTGIFDNRQVWPHILQTKLRSQEANQPLSVINGGVGGWSTIQSLVRLSTWGPLLKPDLLIVYQVKNEFTPMFNGRASETTVFPDYANVMAQISDVMGSSLVGRVSSWQKINDGISSVYVNRLQNGSKNLGRLDSEFVDGILNRFEIITQTAKIWDAQVMLVPEIVASGPYKKAVDQVGDRLQNLADRFDHVHFWDPRPLMPTGQNYFLDKMHLSSQGCYQFADLLSRQVQAVMMTNALL
ncbi:MAG: hypothetical protein AAF215_32565 [Cyanobacteria bacterium P01_A01_bin.123]